MQWEHGASIFVADCVAFATLLEMHHIAQVDARRLDARANQHLPWARIVTDAEGSITEMLYPPLAIAALFFHPKNFAGMHLDAAERRNEEGERVYGHPFTCNLAVEAQKEVDKKPVVPGVRNVLVGVQGATDKTDVEREKSLEPTHLKLWNTGLAEWFKRHSKILGLLNPPFVKGEDDSDQENARAHQRQWQRSFALLLVVLEACARRGILCHHRSTAAAG